MTQQDFWTVINVMKPSWLWSVLTPTKTWLCSGEVLLVKITTFTFTCVSSWMSRDNNYNLFSLVTQVNPGLVEERHVNHQQTDRPISSGRLQKRWFICIIYSLVSKYQPEINPWLVLWFQVTPLLLWHKVYHYDSLIQMKTAADEYKVSLLNYHQDRQILHQGNSIVSVYRWKL